VSDVVIHVKKNYNNTIAEHAAESFTAILSQRQKGNNVF
jgi:hypothetical protein